ncbi:hypothetical protein CEXT_313851 [Caerostris extrusa]|uniref:Uncharacterized protein n=1 Tax=Caerostris extrusa TaxID=172846 RepID=A0AAV4QI29_CAEEX|nr:hypothetical protein CEXT_313851 [Caerostris extrusa]
MFLRRLRWMLWSPKFWKLFRREESFGGSPLKQDRERKRDRAIDLKHLKAMSVICPPTSMQSVERKQQQRATKTVDAQKHDLPKTDTLTISYEQQRTGIFAECFTLAKSYTCQKQQPTH